jgi:ligand-binding SRPBCC domain-containing protein
MAIHLLERSQLVPRPRAEVFAFFADARNLERLTPGFLSFKILTPDPIEMRPGTLIDYRLSLFGIGFRWRTEIVVFEPGIRFVDVQLRGPYQRWHHAHGFADAPGGGTLIEDRVEYQLPLGPLGELAWALVVRRQLDTIFEHRRRIIEALWGTPPAR